MGVLKLTKGGWIGYLQPSGNLEVDNHNSDFFYEIDALFLHLTLSI